MRDLKPVVVRSPVVDSGLARVVVDGGWGVGVVVTKDEKHDLRVVGDGSMVSPGRFVFPLAEFEDEVLTVVKAGGCTCGKPWMKGPAQPLVDSAVAHFGLSDG